MLPCQTSINVLSFSSKWTSHYMGGYAFDAILFFRKSNLAKPINYNFIFIYYILKYKLQIQLNLFCNHLLIVCLLSIQSDRSSSVHNFETRDDVPFKCNNAATQWISSFAKIIKYKLLRTRD